MHYICTYALGQKINRAMKQNTIDWEAVGRRIRALRGLETTQASFANEIGISQGQLSRYEKGNSEISAAVLLVLAEKSDRSIEWLLTGKDRVRPSR
jgi:transcriptional regulator with XRE-family HTH domain